MCFDAFDDAADLDVLDHPILNFIYYLVSFPFTSSATIYVHVYIDTLCES